MNKTIIKSNHVELIFLILAFVVGGMNILSGQTLELEFSFDEGITYTNNHQKIYDTHVHYTSPNEQFLYRYSKAKLELYIFELQKGQLVKKYTGVTEIGYAGEHNSPDFIIFSDKKPNIIQADSGKVIAGFLLEKKASDDIFSIEKKVFKIQNKEYVVKYINGGNTFYLKQAFSKSPTHCSDDYMINSYGLYNLTAIDTKFNTPIVQAHLKKTNRLLLSNGKRVEVWSLSNQPSTLDNTKPLVPFGATTPNLSNDNNKVAITREESAPLIPQGFETNTKNNESLYTKKGEIQIESHEVALSDLVIYPHTIQTFGTTLVSQKHRGEVRFVNELTYGEEMVCHPDETFLKFKNVKFKATSYGNKKVTSATIEGKILGQEFNYNDFKRIKSYEKTLITKQMAFSTFSSANIDKNGDIVALKIERKKLIGIYIKIKKFNPSLNKHYYQGYYVKLYERPSRCLSASSLSPVNFTISKIVDSNGYPSYKDDKGNTTIDFSQYSELFKNIYLHPFQGNVGKVSAKYHDGKKGTHYINQSGDLLNALPLEGYEIKNNMLLGRQGDTICTSELLSTENVSKVQREITTITKQKLLSLLSTCDHNRLRMLLNKYPEFIQNKELMFIFFSTRNFTKVDILIESGANLNISNGDWTLLHQACERGAPIRIIKKILESGQNPNAVCYNPPPEVARRFSCGIPLTPYSASLHALHYAKNEDKEKRLDVTSYLKNNGGRLTPYQQEYYDKQKKCFNTPGIIRDLQPALKHFAELKAESDQTHGTLVIYLEKEGLIFNSSIENLNIKIRNKKTGAVIYAKTSEGWLLDKGGTITKLLPVGKYEISSSYFIKPVEVDINPGAYFTQKIILK